MLVAASWQRNRCRRRFDHLEAQLIERIDGHHRDERPVFDQQHTNDRFHRGITPRLPGEHRQRSYTVTAQFQLWLQILGRRKRGGIALRGALLTGPITQEHIMDWDQC